jgi:hypothetical protein
MYIANIKIKNGLITFNVLMMQYSTSHKSIMESRWALNYDAMYKYKDNF